MYNLPPLLPSQVELLKQSMSEQQSLPASGVPPVRFPLSAQELELAWYSLANNCQPDNHKLQRLPSWVWENLSDALEAVMSARESSSLH